MDAIHSSGPVGWIEQLDVSMVHVQPWEPSVICSSLEHSGCVVVPLDGKNWSVSKNEVCI
nr:hypothetical protein [Pseudomaricurvus alkylphenolicus]